MSKKNDYLVRKSLNLLPEDASYCKNLPESVRFLQENHLLSTRIVTPRVSVLPENLVKIGSDLKC